MNFIQKSLLKFALKAAGAYSVSDPKLGDALARIFGTKTYTGRSVDDESAMQLSVVWACNRIICETIASLPGSMYEAKGDDWVKVKDHQLGDVLRYTPNPEQTGGEYMEAMTGNLNLRGNGYSFIDRGSGGEIIALHPIPASNCQPVRNRDTGVVSFDVTDRGKKENFPREKIWHVKGYGVGGLEGLSPVQFAKQSIGISLAMEEFSGRFFSQGAKSAGILRIPQFLNPEQRKAARDSLEGYWSGMENAHKMRLLEGGIEYEPVTMPLDDAQFLQSRGFQIQEICRIYRIPPHMVADLERATFSNIEQMSLEFVIFTLLPWLTRYEGSITRWLIPAGQRHKYRYRFNFDGLLRGDMAARREFYASALQNGWLNRNEVRELENRNRVPDPAMNEYTVQMNLSPIDQLAAAIAKQTAKPAASAPPVTTASTMPPAPAKSGDVNLDIRLPDSMKHDLNHRIDLPSIVALANEVKRGNEANKQIIRLIDRGFDDLSKTLSLPRVALFDDQGNPVGSRIVGTKESGVESAAFNAVNADEAINGPTLAKLIESEFKTLGAILAADREILTDEKGEPIGSRIKH